MKLLCVTEFAHSGVRLYYAGTVYDLSEKAASQLIALDSKRPLGALSFFSPVDDEAIKYISSKKGTQPVAAKTSEVKELKLPTRAELIAEAKSLGIKGADSMKVEDLKQVIEAARKGTQSDTATASNLATTTQE